MRRSDVSVAQRDASCCGSTGSTTRRRPSVADLHRSVSNFSERGMLGMAIDPGYNRARRATRTVRLTR
jgi:hypothetical protein